MRPFQPPSSPAEVVDQLRNLHNGLVRLQSITQLPSTATDADRNAKINEVIAALSSVTTGGTKVRG